ncbi:O-antigen ligase family protein [Fundicoccus sp. Sow4_D5]|uniref:O-antigen ligase family protein n=1 Tax=Fundicoccus sp. Sow4_D5 TaxID=3438782 RepID=UPI003F91E9CA
MKKYLSSLMFGAIIMAFFSFEYEVYLQLLLAGLTLFGLIWGIARVEIRLNVLIHPYSLMMGALLIWSFLSIVWVADRSSWIVNNGILAVTFIYGLSLSYLIREKSFRRALSNLIIGVIFVHHLVGWFELLTHQQYLSAENWNFAWRRQLHNPMIFFGNINDFALFCFFGLIFIMCWHPLEGKVREIDGKYFIGFKTLENYSKTRFLVLMIFKVLMSLSGVLLIYFANARGILLAAAYSFVFYFILHIKHRLLRRLTIVGIGILAVMTVLTLYTDIMAKLWEDGSFVIRYNLIRNGWHHLKSSHYLGVGAGNTEYYMAHFNYYDTGGYRVMHNWWMGMLVEFGVPFFLLYGLYHARVFLTSYYWSIKYNSQMGKWIVTWLLGFIVAGFIPNTLFNFVWFWFIHNFVFVWFEYRASATEFEEKQADLDLGLKKQLNRLSNWLEVTFVGKISE